MLNVNLYSEQINRDNIMNATDTLILFQKMAKYRYLILDDIIGGMKGENGGSEGTRTLDLLRDRQAL